MSYALMRPAYDTRLKNLPAKTVLIMLADQANAEGFGHPSLKFIAHQTEINIRTVRRIMQVFIEMGLIVKTKRGPKLTPGLQLNMELLGKDLIYEFALSFRAAQSAPENGLSDRFSEMENGLTDRSVTPENGLSDRSVENQAGNKKTVSQTAKTVSQTAKTVSQTVPPHPHIGNPANVPLLSHDPVALAIERGVEAIMQGCSFVSSDIRLVIRKVLEQEADKGEDPATAALAMIRAWQNYTRQGSRLRFKWGAKRLFGDGYWSKPDSWPWDATVLREEIERRNH